MATKLTVGVMPKSTRNPYFEDCRKGAQEAAQELDFELRWEGPGESDAQQQVRVVEAWVREGLPVIAVSVEDRQKLSPVLRDARTKGIKVITWDADAERDARDFTVVQATPEAIGQALTFEVGRMLGGKGSVAGITSSRSAANQNAWTAEFRTRLTSHSPDLKLVTLEPCDDMQDKARQIAHQYLKTLPDVKALVGFCSPAVPGMAQAVKEAGRRDVRITGVSLPRLCAEYIQEGIVDSVITWSSRNLGYLAALAAHALAKETLRIGAFGMRAGRLGSVVVRDDEIRLGRCHIVTKGNLEQFQ